MTNELRNILIENNLGEYINIFDKKNINSISKIKKITEFDLKIMDIKKEYWDNIFHMIKQLPEIEFHVSGSIGGFDMLKIKFYFVMFIILITVGISSILTFVFIYFIYGRIILRFLLLLPIIAPLSAILGKQEKMFYTISANKIIAWDEAGKYKETYDKQKIKKILIKNDCVILYVKIEKVFYQLTHIIKKDFFDDFDKYKEMIELIKENYKEKIYE